MCKITITYNSNKAMVGKQVITVSLDGKLSGLDHKNKGLDLRQFGKANIQRATLIEWDSYRQLWFIRWECGEHSSDIWTDELFDTFGVDVESLGGSIYRDELEDSNIVCFTDYDEAVRAEVAVIQAMQLSGQAASIFP